MGSAEVGPHHSGPSCNAQISRHILKARCLHNDAVHIASVVESARPVVLCCVHVVVGRVGVGASFHRSPTAIEGVNGQVGPVILVQDNPLAVVHIRSCTGDPVACVATLNGGLPHNGVILGAIRDASHFPTGTGIAVPIAHCVNLHIRRFVTLHNHEPIVSVGQESEGLVCHSQDAGIRRRMGDDVNSTRLNGCAFCEVVPEVVVAWPVVRSVAYARVGVTTEVNGRGSRVVNLEVLVVGTAFCSFREKQVVTLGL